MNTRRFLKYVWPFYNMHERVNKRKSWNSVDNLSLSVTFKHIYYLVIFVYLSKNFGYFGVFPFLPSSALKKVFLTCLPYSKVCGINWLEMQASSKHNLKKPGLEVFNLTFFLSPDIKGLRLEETEVGSGGVL